MRQKPVMLLILDGWGYRKEITEDNAIEQGNTPNWHKYLQDYPHNLIATSGLSVGLPDGQMGNSEVGHTNLGAGRVVMQDLPKIDQSISDKTIEQNTVLQELILQLKNNGKTCHLMGLMSPGGVHSSQAHILAISEILNRNGVKTAVHAFLDGRDTPPESAAGFLSEFEKDIKDLSLVKVATLSGRFYAMDRDKRWDRVEAAYNNMVEATGKRYESSDAAIKASYAIGTSDEFVVPCVIGDYKGIEDGDAVLMANFRADRAREILYALADKEFNGFNRHKIAKLSMAVGMTEYSVDHNRFMKTMFPPESLKNIFGEVIAANGLTQLRIAETEKYAHVTFFFNGGEEKEFEGESRILIPSPKVATYDLKPEMSVYEVTDNLIDAITNQKFDVIICNFANGDMVGHTGIMSAALKAVAAVDECLGKVVEAIKSVDGVILVTADHGNAEKMKDEITGQPYTAHTVGDVQAVLINAPQNITGLNKGKLADIAPTLLDLLQIKQPAEMSGRSLLIKK
ncbi:MAG: 2,3-bisphosphoglycerate-independent phosphoglycerate mutase [Alphaproteobacteria bacterium]|nr:2,3-bisphosphoglycerate-independent phosphoglycerate mutase [Alphaproteobacteria bacterium]